MTIITLLALLSFLLAIAGMAKPAWNPYAIGTAVILLSICFLLGAHGEKLF